MENNDMEQEINGCLNEKKHKNGHDCAEHAHNHNTGESKKCCHEGHCCCHEHDNDDEDCCCGEETGLKKIIFAAVLFACGLAVEHIYIFEKTLSQVMIGSVNLYRFTFLAFYFAAFLLCGKNVIKSALKNIGHGKIFDEQFLMTVASLGAIFVGEIGEAVAVMLFYNVGEFFQDFAVDKSRDSISALMDIRPDKAFVYRNGAVCQVHGEEVQVGELIEVKPGERVALDGVVESGSSYMDTSALTGESVPRKVEQGEEVLSGFINTQGVVLIKVTKPYGESAVSRILELTQKAGKVKAKSEKFITRFAKIYTPIVCFLALAVAILPPLFISFFTGRAEAVLSLRELYHTWIYRGLMFLVVSCPCALVISVPLSFFSGIGKASSKGILIKGSNFIEILSKADTAVFDKTGTLTKGIFAVNKVFAVKGVDEDDLIAVAAHAEYFSNHPISSSLKKSHFERNRGHGLSNECCNNCKKENCTELSGLGIKIMLDGKTVLAGNKKLMEKENVQIPSDILNSLGSEKTSGTVVHVAQDNVYKGAIIISDDIKEDSFDTIAQLKKLGIKETVMLTGDNAETATLVAGDLGIDKVFASLLPEDKVSRVEDLIESKNEPGTASKGSVIFVGDGVNDSPVLACSDAGISMGSLGSDAAIEASDVVIMDDKPSRLVDAIKISRRTMKIVYENIFFSLGIKCAVMVLGTAGITNMWFAVFGDVGVTILAVLNAMRLLYSPLSTHSKC